MLTVIETCRISPPPATVGHRSLPLTFYDIMFLSHFPINQLFFYESSHSRPQFIKTIVPNLKHSLSITLQHYFPFTSNLIVSPHSTKPEIRYVEGDSVRFTVAECDLDFKHLAGHHPRECDKFYELVPPLGCPVKTSDFMVIPLFAVQVTLFANYGFSIGITNHHVLCDASTKYEFLMAWASIARQGTDEALLANRCLPVFERLVQYPESLDKMFMSQAEVETLSLECQPRVLVDPSYKVRASFILKREKINLIKRWVSIELPALEYVSSFSVACAYVWSCIAISRAKIGKMNGQDELERFVCLANFRSRMDPPLPPTYFGNCVGPCVAITKSALLSGNKGFFIAVEALGNAISKTVRNKDEMLKEAESWFEMMFKLPAKIPAKIGVAGTPKVKIYDVDFGWGKPKKYETISIDCNGSISVNASRDSPDDLEIGLSLLAKQMDAFIDIFNKGLENSFS